MLRRMLLSAGTAKNILHRMKQKFIPAFWNAASTRPKSFRLPLRTAVPDKHWPSGTTEDVFFARQIPPPVQRSRCPQNKAVKAGPRCSCLSILSPCMARSLYHLSASIRHEETIPSAPTGPNPPSLSFTDCVALLQFPRWGLKPFGAAVHQHTFSAFPEVKQGFLEPNSQIQVAFCCRAIYLSDCLLEAKPLHAEAWL